jgi:NADPH-dependent glutamate synthase beta subunit-like oxidoreductase
MGLITSTEQIDRKKLGYIPAVSSFLANAKSRPQKNQKVLVIGSGCAGLGAAWHLNRTGVDVYLYEELEKLGGHANTITGKYYPLFVRKILANIYGHFY